VFPRVGIYSVFIEAEGFISIFLLLLKVYRWINMKEDLADLFYFAKLLCQGNFPLISSHRSEVVCIYFSSVCFLNLNWLFMKLHSSLFIKISYFYLNCLMLVNPYALQLENMIYGCMKLFLRDSKFTGGDNYNFVMLFI